MKEKKFYLLSLAAGILLSIGVMTVFSACGPKEDGSFMHCHDAQLFLFFLGIAIAVLNAIYLFVKKEIVGICLGIINAICGLAAIVLPGTLVAICSSEMSYMMRCNTMLKPFSIVMGIVIFILSVFSVIDLSRKNKKESKGIEE